MRDKSVGVWEMTLVLLVLANLVAEGVRRHKKPPVWVNPCKPSEYWKGKNRHHESVKSLQVTGRGQRASPRPLRRLRMQVTITLTHISSLTPALPQIICNKVSTLGAMISYSWLPRNQTHWYRKHVKCLDKSEKEGLQRYSASFEILKSVKNSHGLPPECRTRRQKVMNEFSSKLQQLLCELEKTMADLGIQYRNWLDEKEANNFMPDYHRDFTTGQIYDWGVLSSYVNYMEDWNKIVRQVVGPKGDAKCKRNLKYKTVK